MKENPTYSDEKGDQFWRLPGFTRPVWILDREYHATATSPARKSRIYVKLNADSTVKVFNHKRPWLQWLKPKPRLKPMDELDVSIYDAVGSWMGLDESKDDPIFDTYKLTIEINDGLELGRTKYEARCKWGRMDGYAPFFRPGKMYKFKGSQKGLDVRLGEYEVGNLMIRCNVQRPLVSKDFLAFQ